LEVNFSFILPLALCAVIDLHVEHRRTTMAVKKHEEPLMQLVVLCKLGPSTPEVNLATPIVVHLHLIWRSASRLFAENRLTKLASIHELGELQRNALLYTALRTSDAEEGIDLGRRRISIARSDARAWSSSSRYLGLVFAPQGAPGRRFADADEEATRVASFGLFLLPRGRPHPRFSISTPASRLAPPASAIEEGCAWWEEKP
jgi:hypothetical protein